MPARPCNCCCSCQISDDDWADTTFDETFEFKRNVSSASTTISQVSGDGTTLGCKRYTSSSTMTTPLVANESPSLELDCQLVYDIATPPAYNPGGPTIQTYIYASTYTFGQILPATAITPDGHPIIVNMSIDWAARYRETTANATGSTTVYYDASIPTVTAGGGTPQPQLAARQCGQIFLLRSTYSVVEGRTGLQYTGSSSFPDNVAGDWYRLVPTDPPHGFDVNLSADKRWEVWDNPTDVNTSLSFVPAYPNFCAGADPIEFGWYIQYDTSQQTQYNGSSTLVDQRVSHSRATLRIDRMCINVSRSTDNLCSCWNNCFGMDLPQISMQYTLGVVQCNWTLLESSMLFRNAINWSTDAYRNGNSDGYQCEFVAGYATITATSGTNNSNANAKLWARLGDSHAIMRLRVDGVDAGSCNGVRNETIRWYCSNDFDGSGGTFLKSNLSDTGGNAAVASSPWSWANLAAFNAGFHNASFTTITIDGMPSSISIAAENCSLCSNDPICCGDPPEEITVSVGVAGSGVCYSGAGTFTLPRSPSGGVESRWAGDDDESSSWVIRCVDDVWRIDSPDNNLNIIGAVSSSCTPFEIVFEKTSGSCTGTVVTVTI